MNSNSQDSIRRNDTLSMGTPTNPPTSRSLKNSSNYFVILFGVIMLAGLLLLAWIGSPATVTPIGERLPPLDIQPLIATEEVPTVDGLKGSIVVLHFWGVWSPESVAEYPGFVSLARRYADHDEVKIFSVVSSAGPDFDLDALRKTAEDFMQREDGRLPTYADPAAMTRGELSLLFPKGTFSYPTTLLIDREGVIVEVIRRDVGQLAEKIEAML